MVKIVLIAGTYQPDRCGVAHYTHNLRREFYLKGLNTIVFTTHAAAQNQSDVNVVGSAENWSLQALVPLLKSIHHYQNQSDLIHIQHAAGTYQFCRAIFLLPILLRITGWRKPIVTTVHEYGWWEWQPKWIPDRLLEWLKNWGQSHHWWDREDGFLLTYSDAIISTNRPVTQMIYARLPELSSKVMEVPIGANISVIECDRAIAQMAVRQAGRWSTDSLVIAFFGFLHPVKGLETLLPAFKRVLAEHPTARLLLVGGVESLALPSEPAAHYWNQLQSTIAALKLQSTVHMTGYVDDAIASHYLSGADVGVLPFNHGVTLKSGSLLALMAHGLPVVATRSTPPDPDLDSSPVQFTASRDVAGLAMELSRLLSNAALRKQLSRVGQLYTRSFAWSAIASTHLAIYQKVMNQSYSS